jgi:hypothetical protein
LWLLDEPYANLDRIGIALVNQLLEMHTARGGAAMVTSHGGGFHGGAGAPDHMASLPPLLAEGPLPNPPLLPFGGEPALLSYPACTP